MHRLERLKEENAERAESRRAVEQAAVSEERIGRLLGERPTKARRTVQ